MIILLKYCDILFSWFIPPLVNVLHYVFLMIFDFRCRKLKFTNINYLNFNCHFLWHLPDFTGQTIGFGLTAQWNYQGESASPMNRTRCQSALILIIHIARGFFISFAKRE